VELPLVAVSENAVEPRANTTPAIIRKIAQT
jgi:hypothetical protein